MFYFSLPKRSLGDITNIQDILLISKIHIKKPCGKARILRYNFSSEILPYEHTLTLLPSDYNALTGDVIRSRFEAE